MEVDYMFFPAFEDTACSHHTIGPHLVYLNKLERKTEDRNMSKVFAELEEEDQQQLYLQMGVFYQNGGLLNSLTVGENIALPLEQHTDLPDVEEALVHRGGLRARIVETGTVGEGDSVGPISE